MNNSLTSQNIYLNSVLQDLTPKLICDALELNYSEIKKKFIANNYATELNTLNFWSWTRYGKVWSKLDSSDRQRCLVDFANMNGVNTGDYFPLPDDNNVFNGIRRYEKLRLNRIFGNPNLINSDKVVGDPLMYDSLAARRVLLFLNILQLEEDLPDAITPIWVHYKQMENYVKGG